MHKHEETQECINKYFKDVQWLEYKPTYHFPFQQVLLNMQYGDMPDAFSICGKDVYIFEHFRIDPSFSKKGKGTNYMKEDHLQINKEKDYFSNKADATYTCKLCVPSSLSFYKKNLIDTFDKHAKHIQDYINNVKSNISDPDKYKYYVCFIIEDIVWCGTTYYANSDMDNLLPFQIKDFLDEAIKAVSLDYIFFCSNSIGHENLFYMIKTSDLKDAYKYCIDENKTKIIDNNPSILSFKKLIKNK